MADPRRATRLGLALALVAACGPGAPTLTAVPVLSPGSAIVPTASPGEATPSRQESLPPGVTRVHDGVLDPGIYRFDGFAPGLQLEIPTAGWEVGHLHAEFFDLFLDGDFPSIGFGRFTDVEEPDGARRPMTDADAVIAALRDNDDASVGEVGSVEVDGRTARAVNLRVTEEQTPLFSGPGGTYHMDPGFRVRLTVVEVDGGGVLEILVIAHGDDLAGALEATGDILESVAILD